MNNILRSKDDIEKVLEIAHNLDKITLRTWNQFLKKFKKVGFRELQVLFKSYGVKNESIRVMLFNIVDNKGVGTLTYNQFSLMMHLLNVMRNEKKQKSSKPRELEKIDSRSQLAYDKFIF